MTSNTSIKQNTTSSALPAGHAITAVLLLAGALLMSGCSALEVSFQPIDGPDAHHGQIELTALARAGDDPQHYRGATFNIYNDQDQFVDTVYTSEQSITRLSNLKPGVYHVQTFVPGVMDSVRKIRVLPGQRTQVTYHLRDGLRNDRWDKIGTKMIIISSLPVRAAALGTVMAADDIVHNHTSLEAYTNSLANNVEPDYMAGLHLWTDPKTIDNDSRDLGIPQYGLSMRDVSYYPQITSSGRHGFDIGGFSKIDLDLSGIDLSGMDFSGISINGH
jgi:hypothetical protein